ncbi:MAG: exonuclease domain-containing protein [Weeksellaceae bacterium]
MNEFYVLDVETANADYSSICQIGIAKFQNGELIEKWESLIDPEDYFDGMNISIHGITERMVKGSPTFEQIYPEIKIVLENEIVGHHMPFDRVAINRACQLAELELMNINWLDSAKIVRRTWEEFAYSGYGLSNIANHLGIEFKHHNALEDAIATGKVMLKAFEKSEMNLEDWSSRIKKPINIYANDSTSIKIEGNPEGPLYGENIVFTGALMIPRAEAGKIASELGCNVSNSITKKTTMLVVGIQDTTKLAGYAKSSKHRKAEDLINKGIEIRILSENDFGAITHD